MPIDVSQDVDQNCFECEWYPEFCIGIPLGKIMPGKCLRLDNLK